MNIELKCIYDPYQSLGRLFKHGILIVNYMFMYM